MLKIVKIKNYETVNGICLFRHSLRPSGRGWKHPHKITGTTKAMTVKFLPDVGIGRHKIKKRLHETLKDCHY